MICRSVAPKKQVIKLMIGRSQVIHYLGRRDVLVWLFIEYLVVEAVDDFHELVNVIFFSRDAPKLEDAPAHIAPKIRTQGCCDHLIKPLRVGFIEDGLALRQPLSFFISGL